MRQIPTSLFKSPICGLAGLDRSAKHFLAVLVAAGYLCPTAEAQQNFLSLLKEPKADATAAAQPTHLVPVPVKINEPVAFQDFVFVKKLAYLLPEGRLNSFRITSAVVIGDRSGYYLKVKISNGDSVTLDMVNLAKMVAAQSLELANNFVLVKDANQKYQFFDRNAFHKQAFAAKVYLKLGSAEDPYHFIALPYGVRSFSLVQKDSYYGRDLKGAPYVYRIHFWNGNDLYLTLNEAYQDYMRGAFVSNLPAGSPYFQLANRINFMAPKPVQKLANYGKAYSLEINFQSDLIYNPSMVAFSITKSNDFGLEDPKNYFYFDLYLPNAIFNLKAEEKEIKSFAFFDRLYLIQDPADKNRSILRALVRQEDIDFFESPPEVAVVDKNTLRITYYQGVDQTSPNFHYAAPSSAQQKIIDLAAIKARFNQTPYYRAFNKALADLNLQSNAESPEAQIAGLFDSLNRLSEVGTYAETDEQLAELVEVRNNTIEWLYDTITTYAQQGMRAPEFNRSYASQQISLLEPYILKLNQRTELAKLKKQLLLPK